MKDVQSFRVSFEFYPPKSLEGSRHLAEAAVQLATAAPDFFSVTFGAGGSTRDGTIETVNMLQQKTNIPVAPHLSCIGFNQLELNEILSQYQRLGVKRIVALRGDIPSGMVSSGEFKFASDLIQFIRDVSGDYFHIEVAAYPEYHPQAKNAFHDVLNLKRKYEAGANSAITQYFFNPDAYFYFLDECAKQQVFIPIFPGIMPIMQFHKLMRFSELCGAEVPRWLCKRLASYGDDIQSIQAFGIEVVHQLCQRLMNGGAPGLHFYTLNTADLSMQLLERLNLSRVGVKSEIIDSAS